MSLKTLALIIVCLLVVVGLHKQNLMLNPSSIASTAVTLSPLWGAQWPRSFGQFFVELQLPWLKFHHSRVFIAAQTRPQGVCMLHRFDSDKTPPPKNHKDPVVCKRTSLINELYVALWIVTVTTKHTLVRWVPWSCSLPDSGWVDPTAGRSCPVWPLVCWLLLCFWHWTKGPGSWSTACPWWAASPPGLPLPSGTTSNMNTTTRATSNSDCKPLRGLETADHNWTNVSVSSNPTCFP